MKFEKTNLDGVYIIQQLPFEDSRGSFARMFCKKELAENGLRADIAQCNISFNFKKGTIRGMHSQAGEAAEDKIVSCVSGRLYDVCVDVRKDSPTFGQYVGVELTPENGKMLYVPKGYAHGYQALEDNTRAVYFVTEFYTPNSEVGYRYDDPAFSINWPISENIVISEKDKSWRLI